MSREDRCRTEDQVPWSVSTSGGLCGWVLETPSPFRGTGGVRDKGRASRDGTSHLSSCENVEERRPVPPGLPA